MEQYWLNFVECRGGRVETRFFVRWAAAPVSAPFHSACRVATPFFPIPRSPCAVIFLSFLLHPVGLVSHVSSFLFLVILCVSLFTLSPCFIRALVPERWLCRRPHCLALVSIFIFATVLYPPQADSWCIAQLSIRSSISRISSRPIVAETVHIALSVVSN